MKCLRIVGLACVASFTLGCGEVIAEPPSGLGGSGGGGGGGAGGSGGAGASAGSSMTMAGSSGSSSMGGSTAMEPDAGAGGSGGFQYPANCPVPNPMPASPTQAIALQSFNFLTSEVVLKNISSRPQTIVGERLGWQWCSFPAYWNIAPQGDVTLPPGKTYKFELIYNTEGVWPLPPEGSELAIYIQSGTFDEPDKLVSFVSWGEGLATAGREYVAVLAGLWTLGERAELGVGDSGFIVTGPGNEAASYEGVPARCLVAPPNGE